MGDRSPFPVGYLIVELFYSGAWVDVSADVTDAGAIITRGQPNEGPTVATPSSMTVTLFNRAGKYSPRNPRSPLYGLIGRGTPIRVSVKPQGLAPSIRYTGEVYEWPVSWGLTGGPSVTVSLVGSGVLRQLAQSAAPSISAARRSIAAQPGIIGYWPLEDVGAARFAAAVGAGVPVGPGVTLAAVSPWAGSKALPTFSTGRFTGYALSYTNTNEIQFRWVGRFTESMALGTLMSWGFKGGTISRIDLEHPATGVWQFTPYNASGDNLTTTIVPFSSLLSTNVQFSFQLSQVGANISAAFAYILPGQITGNLSSFTISGQAIGAAYYFKINPNQLNWATNEVGHVSISNDITSVFTVRNQIDGYPGESASARITRILAERSIPLQSISGGGFPQTMGTQPTAGPVDVLAECLDVGQGMVYESRTVQDGLVLRNAYGTFNQTPKLSVAYTDNLIRPLDPVDDDQNTTNNVTVTRKAGGAITVTQPTGPLGITTVGTYETQADLNLASETQLLDQATWRLTRGTYDVPRWPRLGLDLAHPTFLSNSTLTGSALAVDIGDRIQISNAPTWLPPDAIDQRVIGVVETITPWNHRVEFNTDPNGLLVVGNWNGTTGRYSGAGTVLAVALTASSTTVNVTPPTGVTWTASDGSYAVMVGGEIMTVTAVTGNTFTVVRGVNGYASAHPAGRAVDLADSLARYSI